MNLKFFTKLFFLCMFLFCFSSLFSQTESNYVKLKDAQNFYYKGNKQQAGFLFEKLSEQKDLPPEIATECSKYFLKEEKYQKALSLLENNTDNSEDSVYVKALSLTGVGKENEALAEFEKILNSKFSGYANYYSGIINFRNENYEKAFEQFQKAAAKVENINYSWNARYYCSRSAAMLSKIDNAVSEAEKALRFSYNDSQTALAIELLSGLYTEKKDFSKAEKMLLDNSNKSGKIGMTALYQLGIIYARQGKNTKADETWKTFLFNYPYSELTEEISFRRAELCYNLANWKDASEQFSQFRTKYPNSNFAETAMFYQAESLKNLISENKFNENRVLMLCQNYLKMYPDGMFRYQCYENCLKIYYAREEYAKALECVNNILRFFPNQIGNDKVLKQKLELSRLVNDKNINDPDYFLANAEKYANEGDAENAAYSMYCAAEAFINSGRTDDAKEILVSMKKIFPNSEWTLSAEKLF